MALQNTVTTRQGFLATDAYHRVEQPTLTSNVSMQFMASSYKDSNESVSFDVDMYSCAYDINGVNPIKQAYLHLKTLPEFADATDV